MNTSTPSITDIHLRGQIEAFLFFEARLLDERKYTQWLELVADDIRYYIPNRFTPHSVPKTNDLDRAREFDEEDLPLGENNKLTLAVRAERLNQGLTFSEAPPSRCDRLITNIEVYAGDSHNGNGDEYQVFSKELLIRSRHSDAPEYIVATRKDRLRKTETGFEVAERRIELNTTVLNTNNLSVFF